jgi:hypothetical protein
VQQWNAAGTQVFTAKCVVCDLSSVPCLQALKMVQAVRPRVQPNPGFMDQLLAFQEQEWRLLSEEGEHMKQDGGTASAQQATSCALLPV